MKLLLKQYNLLDYKKALLYFDEEYIKSLENKNDPKTSLLARYYISLFVEKEKWIKYYSPIVNEKWIPIFTNNIYWSISHKLRNIFVWVSDKIIWLDVEVLEVRDSSLWTYIEENEWEIIWWKSWLNFYKIWTAKESLIKHLLLDIDSIKDIKLIGYQLKNKMISYHSFDSYQLYSYLWEKYSIYTWKYYNFIYSVTQN